MRGLAFIGWVLAALGVASDNPQPMLVQASAPMCLNVSPPPRMHGRFEPIDPEGDERTVA